MSAHDVLMRAAQLGVNLSVDGGQLRYEALPTSAGVPAGLVEQLRQHKMGLIAILSEPTPHGNCARCGGDTACILTTANGEDWCCEPCFSDKADCGIDGWVVV